MYAEVVVLTLNTHLDIISYLGRFLLCTPFKTNILKVEFTAKDQETNSSQLGYVSVELVGKLASLPLPQSKRHSFSPSPVWFVKHEIASPISCCAATAAGE